ncbi:MAG: outer membrane beta-barrel protein [Pseudomonadota bacterium]
MDFQKRLREWNQGALRLAAVLSCALIPTVSLSEEGAVKLSPRLEIEYSRNDNFFYQRTNKVVGSGLILSPSVLLAAESSRIRTRALISANYAQFDTRGDDDNYFDQTLQGDFTYKAGTSHLISVDGSVQHGHDAFGQARTQGIALVNGELDRWMRGGGELRYRYGAPEALLNFEISGAGSRKIYTSNTAATEVLNYGTYEGSLTTFLNISPKTALLAEGGYKEVRIDRLFGPTDNREASEFFGRVGARWKATAKTSGDVRAGWAERRSDATGARIFQRFDWTASVTWLPSERTTLNVLTGSKSQESYLAGAPVISNRSADLSWKQKWSQRWASTLNTGYTQSEFVNTARTDDISDVGLRFDYRAEKYLSFGLGAGYLHRYSTAPLVNFNGIRISSSMSLDF